MKTFFEIVFWLICFAVFCWCFWPGGSNKTMDSVEATRERIRKHNEAGIRLNWQSEGRRR